MKFSKYLIAALLALPFLFNACSEDPPTVGEGLIGFDTPVLKTIDGSVDTMTVTQNPFVLKASLGAASSFLIGKSGAIEAKALLKFSAAYATRQTDILKDSALVISAKVTLKKNYVYGDTLAPLSFKAFRINSLWDPYAFTYDSLASLQYAAGVNVIGPVGYTDSITTFSVDTALVRGWMKAALDTASGKNYGILLESDGSANKIVGYKAIASDLADLPVLTVILQKTGSYIDTLTFQVANDLHIVNTPAESFPGKIFLRSGVERNTILNFDVSRIPRGAMVTRATLYITKDTLLSKGGKSYSDALGAYLMTDTAAKSYEGGTSAFLTLKSGVYSGDVTNIVARWVADKKNPGLLLTPLSATEGVDLFVLEGVNAVLGKRPYLKITYAVKQ